MGELDQIALHNCIPLLQDITGVTVCDEWVQAGNSNVWYLKLCYEIIVPTPSKYIIPKTNWLLTIDFSSDCVGKVAVYPGNGKDDLKVTFQHQSFNGKSHPSLPCRIGNLCTSTGFDSLSANRNASHIEPQATMPRIVWHINRSLSWLKMAANGTLSPPGSLFELPDFSFEPNIGNAILGYYEDENSLKTWQSSSCKTGIVELKALYGKTSYIVSEYFDLKKSVSLYKPQWGTAIQQQSTTINAIWIRLDSLLLVNHYQVPSTVQEFKIALGTCGIDYDTLIDKTIRHLPKSGETLLVIGMPVPKVIDGLPVKYHWQALRIAPPRLREMPQAARISLIKHHLKMEKKNLEWISKAENWHPDELINRGALAAPLIDSKVLLIGAGALGSAIAEQLIRMGLRKLTIVDDDRFESGNLVRHNLTMPDVSAKKVEALVKRLIECNPSSIVEGLDKKVGDKIDKELQLAFENADLVIDATADDALLRAMPVKGLNREIPFISCSLSLYADRLFLYSSKANTFAFENFEDWFAPFREEQGLLAEQIELPRTAGCWHPLTPARHNRIQGLAGMAIEGIEQIAERNPVSVVRAVIQWPTTTI